MTNIDTTTVSVLFVLVALAVLAGIVTIGFALAHEYAGRRQATAPASPTPYTFWVFRHAH